MAAAAQVAPSALRALADELLAGTPATQPARSFLNNDGLPLQVCIGSSAGGRSVRLLADPAASEPDPRRRKAAGCAVLERRLGAAHPLAPACAKTIALGLPEDAARLDELARGSIWLGAALDSRAIALYVNPCWGDRQEHWPRASHWLSALLPDGADARATVGRLAAQAELASFALEGTAPADARAKLYFRMRAPMAASQWHVPALLEPPLTRFVAEALGSEPVPLSALTFSVSFALASGRVAGGKVDVCAHCVADAAARWGALVRRWTEDHAQPIDLAPLVASGATELALIGLGMDDRGGRVNVYLKGRAA